MQHSIIIIFSVFQVIIAVRPTTVVVGKISYKGKARIEALRELGFGYRTTVAKFPQKGLEALLGKSNYVNGLMSVGRRGSALGNGTKARQQPAENRRTEKNVRYLKLLISENRTLTLMLRHFAKY